MPFEAETAAIQAAETLEDKAAAFISGIGARIAAAVQAFKDANPNVVMDTTALDAEVANLQTHGQALTDALTAADQG